MSTLCCFTLCSNIVTSRTSRLLLLLSDRLPVPIADYYYYYFLKLLLQYYYPTGYQYQQPIISTCGINNEEFHMELPYEEIKVQNYLLFIVHFFYVVTLLKQNMNNSGGGREGERPFSRPTAGARAQSGALGACRLHLHQGNQLPVLRIHDILVWIRIRTRGSIPLTNGSGPDSDLDPAIFVIDLQEPNKKLIFSEKFFCLLLFEGTVHLYHFQR